MTKTVGCSPNPMESKHTYTTSNNLSFNHQFIFWIIETAAHYNIIYVKERYDSVNFILLPTPFWTCLHFNFIKISSNILPRDY